jgi:hypothetical protein
MSKKDRDDQQILAQLVDELCKCDSLESMRDRGQELYLSVKSHPHSRGAAILQAFSYPLNGFLATPTDELNLQPLHECFRPQLLSIRNRLKALNVIQPTQK